MIVYSAVMNLSEILSMGQENTLASFPQSTIIPELVKLVARPQITQMTSEVSRKPLEF